jgi:drug/metabolite transporter (DMT)-like permease
MIPIALAYALTLVLFALANRLTTAANAIFLQSTAPIYVLLISPWLLKEAIRRSDIVYILCVAAGMGIFSLGHDRVVVTAPDPPLGNALALASGVTFAAMLAGLRLLGRVGGGDTALATVAAGNVAAFLIAAPMAMPVTHFRAADAAVILYLGAIQIGLAYWCLTKGISHVPAFEATTMLQVEPAMNPVWTWLLHGERPNTWAMAGGGVIIAATLVNTWMQSRRSMAVMRN